MRVLILLLLSIQAVAQIPFFTSTTNPTAYSEDFVIVDDNVLGDDGYETNYVGTWSFGAPEGFYNLTTHYSAVTADYFEVTFNGTSVEWWTEVKNTHGIAEVFLDDISEGTFDLYNASEDGIQKQ
jgi:hypothetical protein